VSVDREAIYLALFGLLKSKLLVANGGPFVTIGRRLVSPPTLTADEQPALFINETKETKTSKLQASTIPGRGTGGILTLNSILHLYCYRTDITEQIGLETALSATQLNTLLAAIDDALEPKFPEKNNVQSLGGLVYHCKIDGSTAIIDPGMLNQQAAALIPLTILVPQE